GIRGAAGATLTLGGLLIEGGLEVKAELAKLRLLHTTLVPGRSVVQEAEAPITGRSLTVFGTSGNAIINTSLEVQIALSLVATLRALLLRSPRRRDAATLPLPARPGDRSRK